MHNEIDKFCPKCKPIYYREKVQGIAPCGLKQVGVMLETTSSDYSGCGVDICFCPECKQKFQVSYKIDEIKQIDDKAWRFDKLKKSTKDGSLGKLA